MPRRRLPVFVNRESELNEIVSAVKNKCNTIILGLRGYGKSALASVAADLCCRRGMLAIYVDCQRVLTPQDLVDEARRDLSLVGISVERIEVNDAREALESLFTLCERVKASALFLDEFTSLLRKLGRISPFREAGGAMALAEFLRSLIEETELTLIALDTSIKAVYEVVLNYTSPLLRVFHKVMFIDPLPAEHAVELAKKLMALRGKRISDDVARHLVERVYCVPQYIELLVRVLPDSPTKDDVDRTVVEELDRGFLNIYFEALLDKLSDEEKAVLYAISRGKRSYTEIARARTGINVSRALSSLTKARLITRVERGKKRVVYAITDKLFEAWLKMRELPELREDIIAREILSAISFESYVREILRLLPKPTEITDALGRRASLGPFVRVERYCGKLGEVDAIAVDERGHAVVAECYFGGRAKKDKIEELMRSIETARKLGYSVKCGILVSYFGFDNKTLEIAREKADILLIDRRELRKLARIVGLFAL